MLPVWNVTLMPIFRLLILKMSTETDIYKRISAIETEDEYMDMQDERWTALGIYQKVWKIFWSSPESVRWPISAM